MAVLERERRNHEQDLEALRQKFKHEMPLVQKTLLANDVAETKLVIESIRQHYSNELEAKRQQVVLLLLLLLLLLLMQEEDLRKKA
jgi:hypothetical protein